MNANGQVIATYGGIGGPGVDQLNTPARLEMRTKDNCILVADTGNKRVVVLKQNLQHVADLSSDYLKEFLNSLGATVYTLTRKTTSCMWLITL